MSKTYMLTIPREKWVKRALKEFIKLHDIHKWIIAWETGRNGYEHYQVRLTGCIGFDDLKKGFGFAHIEEAVEANMYERKGGYFVCNEDTNDILSCRFGTLRSNQRNIYRKIRKQSDRGITIVFDETGNRGKTWFIRHCYETGRAIYLPSTIRTVQGLIQYVASAYNGQEMILIDIPRSWKWSEELYSAIETIKDGLVYDTRYNASMKDIWGVKVAVFCNTLPKLDKLSIDRWEVIDAATGESL